MTPCPTLLRLLLYYDPATGALIWKPRAEWMFKEPGIGTRREAMEKWNRRHAGTPVASAPTRKGYARFGIGGGKLMAHRAAFAIVHRRYPEVVDHINGDRLDNRICNLRETDHWGNARNTSPRKGSTSRFIGVRRVASTGRWQAHIRLNGKTTVLGTFDSELGAAQAYDAAARDSFGEFARPNFPRAAERKP